MTEPTLYRGNNLLHVQERPGDEELLISQLAPHITSAESDVVIVSPYFVPGKQAAEALCKLNQDGVRVRILTNSLVSNDVAAVHAGYAKYRKPLLRCGVELFELNEQLKEHEQKIFSRLPGLKLAVAFMKLLPIESQL